MGAARSELTASAADERVAETAAERAEVAAPLAGWVNNAALFRDAAAGNQAHPGAVTFPGRSVPTVGA